MRPMSFQQLQSLIKAKKCPLCPTLAPTAGMDPQAAGAFCRERIDALTELVPALFFPGLPFLALGWQGQKVLEEVLGYAGEKGFFTIAGAPLPSLPARCLTVSPYRGSGDILPLLEACRDSERCLLVLAKTAGAGCEELQELIAGDRLVYQVAGDLARRLDKERLGIVAEGVFPSDLRQLRRRWEDSFLMVSGPAEDVRFAFDRYGRGALVRLPAQDGSPDALRAAVLEQRDALREYVTIL